MEMAMVGENSSAELLRAKVHLLNKLANVKDFAALKCAVELGIPDIIQKHGKPATSLSELTSTLPINRSKAHCIYRIMRILVNAGFFVEQKSGDGKLHDEEESNVGAFSSLSEWLQNDDPTPFDTAHGRNFWDYCAEEPCIGKMFNQAMAGDSLLIAIELVTELKFVFEGLTSLVDVGGGTGTTTRAIAKTFPDLKCTVLDGSPTCCYGTRRNCKLGICSWKYV